MHPRPEECYGVSERVTLLRRIDSLRSVTAAAPCFRPHDLDPRPRQLPSPFLYSCCVQRTNNAFIPRATAVQRRTHNQDTAAGFERRYARSTYEFHIFFGEKTFQFWRAGRHVLACSAWPGVVMVENHRVLVSTKKMKTVIDRLHPQESKVQRV